DPPARESPAIFPIPKDRSARRTATPLPSAPRAGRRASVLRGARSFVPSDCFGPSSDLFSEIDVGRLARVSELGVELVGQPASRVEPAVAQQLVALRHLYENREIASRCH